MDQTRLNSLHAAYLQYLEKRQIESAATRLAHLPDFVYREALRLSAAPECQALRLAAAVVALGPVAAGPPSRDLLDRLKKYLRPLPPGPAAAARAYSLPENGRLEKLDDPAVEVPLWFGLGGGKRRSDAVPGSWDDLWPLARLWLRGRVLNACHFADQTLATWGLKDPAQALDDNLHTDWHGVNQHHHAVPLYHVNSITARLIRPDPVHPQSVTCDAPLVFEFSPVPVAHLSVDRHTEEAAYAARWQDAGARVLIGREVVARLRPETRFVFLSTVPLVEPTRRRYRLPADSPLVARCGDLELVVPGKPGCRLTPESRRVCFVPESEAASVVRQVPCDCGIAKCNGMHHVAAWDPLQPARISLVNFIWNAVKGVAVGEQRLTAACLKQSMYYPFLANPAVNLTETPVRSAEVRVFRCTEAGCYEAGERPELVPHSADCAPPPGNKPRLATAHEYRLIRFHPNRVTLRAYARCRDGASPPQPSAPRADDAIHPLSLADQFDQILCWASTGEAAIPSLVRCREWWREIARPCATTHLPAGIKDWRQALGDVNPDPEDRLGRVLLLARALGCSPGWSQRAPNERLDWLKMAGPASPTLEIAAAAAPHLRAADWGMVEQIVRSRPWFFLLAEGLPAGSPACQTAAAFFAARGNATEAAVEALLQQALSSHAVPHFWSREEWPENVEIALDPKDLEAALRQRYRAARLEREDEAQDEERDPDDPASPPDGGHDED